MVGSAGGGEVDAGVLLALAEALGDATSRVEVAAAVTSAAAGALGTQWCYVGVVDRENRRLQLVPVEGRPGDDDEQWTWLALADDHPPCAALRSGEPVFLTDAEETVRRFPGTWSSTDGPVPFQASAHLPLRVGGQVIGTLDCVWDVPRPFGPAERRSLQALARYTGQAMARAQLMDQRRTTAETLQRAMLTDLPEPDHLHLAARYVASGSHDLVGGDWYDAFLTVDGATVLVMGDVTGHDVQAAATMGQLRSLLRGLAYENQTPPAQTLRRLDRAVAGLQVDKLATVLLARIEQPADAAASGMRVLRWSSAGHPPPLLLHGDGRVDVLAGTGDLLIGVDHERDRHDLHVDVEPDATLLLYTDGLVEGRHRGIDEGVARLADRLAALRDLPLRELLERLVQDLRADTDDDTTVLAVRFHPEDRPRPAEAGPERIPDVVDG